jgi:D-glycero-D-manno-heptose 1,7-bisphosphate phosphatase
MDDTDHLSPALFVDRDGTLIVNKHYLADPGQVELIDGSVEALRLARQQGYKIIIVSNQSGVARGYHGYEDVERVNARVVELLAHQGLGVDAIYFCPHHERKGRVPEYSVPCGCRKPAPGMAETAALEHGLDLRRSVVVGDSLADYNLGRVIGARSVLVRTGYGASVIEKQQTLIEQGGITVAENLLHAVRELVGQPWD